MSLTEKILSNILGLNCKNCGYSLTLTDIQIALDQIKHGVMVCPTCKKVMITKPSTEIDKTRITPSARIKVETLPNMLTLEVPWKSDTAFLLGVIGLFFMIGTYFIYYMSHSGKTEINGIYAKNFMEVVYPLGIFLFVGFIIFIGGLILLFGKTLISVNKEKIQVTSNFLTFLFNKIYDVRQMNNLSIKRTLSSSSKNGPPVSYYQINLNFISGESKKLCGIRSLQEALYIESIVETFLGFIDNPNQDEV